MSTSAIDEALSLLADGATPGQDGREGTETNEGSGEGAEALQGHPGAGNGHLRKGG